MYKRFQALIMVSNRSKTTDCDVSSVVVSAGRVRSPLTAAYRSIDSGPSYGGESRSGPKRAYEPVSTGVTYNSPPTGRVAARAAQTASAVSTRPLVSGNNKAAQTSTPRTRKRYTRNDDSKYK